MPFFKSGADLIYFAHVPKCAGTAVEKYLRDRFGDVAFLDQRFRRRPAEERWTKSSPQHLDRFALAKLIPASFFKASFTVVRHPVARLRNAYLVLRDIEGRVPVDQSFGDWLQAMRDHNDRVPYGSDNHPRPMDENG